MCWIKKITPRTEQTFWDRQLCFYVKNLFISEKPQKNELCHFSKEIYVTNFAAGALELMQPAAYTFGPFSCPLYISGVALKKIQMSL